MRKGTKREEGGNEGRERQKRKREDGKKKSKVREEAQYASSR